MLHLAGCAAPVPGILHARLLAGVRDDGSYLYLEIVDAPGSRSVARAVRAESARRHRRLGRLSDEEIRAVRAALAAGGPIRAPARFQPVRPAATLGPLQPGARWPVEVAPGEPARLGLDHAADRYGRQVLAFALHAADGARSTWIATTPADGAELGRLVLLPGGCRAVAEVAYRRAGHHTRILLELGLAEGVARLLDAEGVALLRDHRTAEARIALARALAVDPADATARYNLACALALAGRPDAAMRELAVALTADPHRLASTARSDPDLDALRSRDDFQGLVGPKGERADP